MKTLVKIKRDSYIFKKCLDFAKILSEDNYYSSKRNASSKGDVLRNHKNSKLAEVAVAYLINKEYNLSITPDFEIYNSKGKNWLADLPYRSMETAFPYDIHVKSTDNVAISRVNEKSWVFQWNNNDGVGGRDKLFNLLEEDKIPVDCTDLIALCYVDEKEYHVEIHLEWLLPWREVVNNNILKDPVYEKFIGVKKCIYESDLNQIIGDSPIIFEDRVLVN